MKRPCGRSSSPQAYLRPASPPRAANSNSASVGRRLSRPGRIRLGVGVGDVDDGVVIAAGEIAGGTKGVTPARARHVAPPAIAVGQRHRASGRDEDGGAGDEILRAPRRERPRRSACARRRSRSRSRARTRRTRALVTSVRSIQKPSTRTRWIGRASASGSGPPSESAAGIGGAHREFSAGDPHHAFRSGAGRRGGQLDRRGEPTGRCRRLRRRRRRRVDTHQGADGNRHRSRRHTGLGPIMPGFSPGGSRSAPIDHDLEVLARAGRGRGRSARLRASMSSSRSRGEAPPASRRRARRRPW